MPLSREHMLDRMLASDAGYDGRFITGVLSTGIYCLPSCRARKPKPENVRFFHRPEEAEAAGLRACKRCRPENFYRDHDPDRVLTEELVARLRAEPQAFAGVGEMVAASGVGSSKLHELIRQHYHTTPAAMLGRERVEWACRELLASERAVADIAFDAGFESLSAFGESFRKLLRLSPRRYRELARGDRFTVDLPGYFQRDRVLSYLGRDAASTTERLRGKTLVFGTHAGEVPVAVSVELGKKMAHCRIESAGGESIENAVEIHRQVLRLLGAVVDPRPFERRAIRQPEVAKLIGSRQGLTIPQTGTHFDALVWVIAGQQVSLPVAFGMRRRLAEKIGARLAEGLHASPKPEEVAEIEEGDLVALGWSRRKAEYLLGVSRDVASGTLDLDQLAELPATTLEHRLLAIRGFGPWSVNYLRMRAFGLVDCVPVGDAALTRNLQRFYDLPSRPDAKRTLELMAPFAPYRSLATFHFWAWQEELQ